MVRRSLVHLPHKAAAYRHGQNRYQAAGSQGHSRQGCGISHYLLHEHGEENDCSEHGNEAQKDDCSAEGKVPVAEDTEINHGMNAAQFRRHEKDEAEDGDDGEPGDEVRLEPVLPLTLIQDKLETSES